MAINPDNHEEMRQFTAKDDWDSIYGREMKSPRPGLWQFLKRYLPGDGFPQLIACLLHRHAATDLAGGRILEIGCAPGHWLVSLSKILKMTPYGMDYSEDGCALARQTFESAGYPPDHIMQGDFFDDAVLASLKEKFDLVCSFGFVEHFDDLYGVLLRHVPLLNPKGWLCVTMPNLLYLNSLWQSKEILDRHHLPSMRTGVLQETLSQVPGLRLAWAGYFGVFELRRTLPGFKPPVLANAIQRLFIDPPVRWLSRLGVDPELNVIAPNIGAIAQRISP
jgi:2-polyprenyl-3-methyl-5-hydroxy-6-metoxy-1,4-benzoquinol methylase